MYFLHSGAFCYMHFRSISFLPQKVSKTGLTSVIETHGLACKTIILGDFECLLKHMVQQNFANFSFTFDLSDKE